MNGLILLPDVFDGPIRSKLHHEASIGLVRDGE